MELLVKKRKLNRTVSLAVLMAMLFSLFSTGVMAIPEEDSSESPNFVWHTVRYGQVAVTREASPDLQGTGSLIVDGGSGSAVRETFLRFDLAQYTDLSVEEVRLKLNLTGVAVGGADGAVGIYLLPKEFNSVNLATLLGENLLPEKADPITGTTMRDDMQNLLYSFKPTAVGVHITGNLWPKIEEWINDNDGVSTITLRISKEYQASSDEKRANTTTGTRATHQFSGTSVAEDAPFLRIGFKTLDVEMVDDAIKEVTENFTTEDYKNITANLNMPTSHSNGTSITWSSTDVRVVSAGGQVNRPAFGQSDANVILTARFELGLYQTDEVFDITVLADRMNPDYSQSVLYAAEGTYVSSADKDTAMFGTQSGGQIISDSATATRRIAFLKFDLSEYRGNLDQISSLMLRLVQFNTAINAGDKGVSVSIVNDSDWNADTLTYNNATTLISGASTPVYTFTGQFDDSGVLYSDGILQTIDQYFKDNPSASSVVTFKIESTAGAFSFHNATAASADLRPGLVVISFAYALQETLNFILPEELYEGSIDRVRSDMNLFTEGKYYTTITWSSSNNSVINPSTGAVARQQNDVAVTLTATVTSGVLTDKKDINVTVMGYDSDPAYFRELLEQITFERTIVTGDFTLPVKAELMTVDWTAEDKHATVVNGGDVTVNRLKERDFTTKITASISTERTTQSKDFYFTLIRHSGNDLISRTVVMDEVKDQEGRGTKLKTIDDNINTVWEISGTQISDRTISIDLKSTKVIGEFLVVYDGVPVTGLKIQSSLDSYVWKDALISGNIQPNQLNYLTLDVPMYTQYVRVIFPEKVTGSRFIGGYQDSTGGTVDVQGILESIALPAEVSENFTLPSSGVGYTVSSWTSGDSSTITVSGYSAIVTRQSSDRTVNMTAKVVINQTTYDITRPVLVRKLVQNVVSGGSVGGGGSSSSVSAVSVAGIETRVAPVTETEGTVPSRDVFSDLDDAAWAKEYIMALYDNRIIDGKGDGSFDPNGYLKREEMAKIVVNSFSFKRSNQSCPFADAQEGEWYYEFVCTMYDNRLSNGMGEGLFGVGQNISRQDAVVQLARVLTEKGFVFEYEDLEQTDLDREISAQENSDEENSEQEILEQDSAQSELDQINSDNKSREEFADDEKIADYAKESVYSMKALGIISGDQDGCFNAGNYITRAEMSKVIFMTLELLKQ